MAARWVSLVGVCDFAPSAAGAWHCGDDTLNALAPTFSLRSMLLLAAWHPATEAALTAGPSPRVCAPWPPPAESPTTALMCRGVSGHCPCLRCCLQPVRTFTTPGFCFVHIGNAFESEQGATLDVDLGVFESASILNDLKIAHLRRGPSDGSDVTGCQYMRLSLPLSDADPDAADSSSQLLVGVSAFRGAQGFAEQLLSTCLCVHSEQNLTLLVW